MHEASRRILSVLLQKVEGFASAKKTTVVCATNRCVHTPFHGAHPLLRRRGLLLMTRGASLLALSISASKTWMPRLSAASIFAFATSCPMSPRAAQCLLGKPFICDAVLCVSTSFVDSCFPPFATYFGIPGTPSSLSRKNSRSWQSCHRSFPAATSKRSVR